MQPIRDFNGGKVNTLPLRDAVTPLRIGARDDFAHWLDGDLRELILIRGTVSDAERIAIHDYLARRHGIAVTYHLSVEEHPVVGRFARQTATFAVNAGDPTLAYQWQRNGVDILEATNAFYTTPALSYADSAATYRARVSSTRREPPCRPCHDQRAAGHPAADDHHGRFSIARSIAISFHQ